MVASSRDWALPMMEPTTAMLTVGFSLCLLPLTSILPLLLLLLLLLMWCAFLTCCSAAVVLSSILALLPFLLLVLVPCLLGSGCLNIGRVHGSG